MPNKTAHPPKAFIVLGPESSGTRLLTRILINAGCEGSDQHIQPFDDNPPNPSISPLIVWRRSVPHGIDHEWHGLDELISRLDGYVVNALISVRDQYCTEHSQLKVGHVETLDQARQNIRRAYKNVFSGTARWGLDLTVVPYESLVLGREQAQQNLIRSLGFEGDSFIPVQIVDGNAKYLDVD